MTDDSMFSGWKELGCDPCIRFEKNGNSWKIFEQADGDDFVYQGTMARFEDENNSDLYSRAMDFLVEDDTLVETLEF